MKNLEKNYDVEITPDQLEGFVGEISEKMEPMIQKSIRDFTESFSANLPAGNKAMCLTGKEASKESEVAGFFKAMLNGDHYSAKALSGSTDSAGGYLVPAGFRDEVVARLADSAELAPYVRTVPVSSDAGSIPSLATDISVTWRNAATSENTSFGESSPVFSSIAWALKRADAFTKISRELVADSAPSIIDFITNLFREAISKERDRVIAVGDGSTEPEGLSVNTSIDEVTIDTSVSFADLVELEQSLKRKYRRNARWIMNGTNLQSIYSLTDSQGQPIFMRDVVGGIPESRILGYQVSQQDDLADDTIIFGDLSYYLWFDRGEMGIESTTEGGDAFANHQTWIKVWERVDGKVALPEAFIKGTISSS
jgi:HK97 family phage major capsid protein